MELTRTIEYIYPNLEFHIDYIVRDDNQWEWPYILWYNKEITQPTQAELETAWLEVEKIQKLEEINNSFNEKIKDFNSKYPIEEQKRFSDKLAKAEKVIAWWEDVYITGKATLLWVTPLQFSLIIKHKANIFEEFYLNAENERDLLINNL